MSIAYIPNYRSATLGLRNLSKQTTLGRWIPEGPAPGEQPARAAMNPTPQQMLRTLGRVGVIPVTDGGGQNVYDYPPARSGVCYEWGCTPDFPGGPRKIQPWQTMGPMVPPSPSAPTGGVYAGTTVPVGSPTSAPYVDSAGNTWTYNAVTGSWIEASPSLSYYAGTFVPIGTPTNQLYQDAYGNIWQYNPATATWAAISGGAVSSQLSPTPVLSIPPAAGVQYVVSSGGGVQTPATAVAAPVSTGILDNLSTWLSSTTALFGYNVPNPVLAGAVVLGFAFLSSGRRR